MKKFFSVFLSLFLFCGVVLAQDLGIPGLDYNANVTIPHVQQQGLTDDVLTTLAWTPLATSVHAVSRSCCALITIGGSDYIYQFGGGSGAQYTTVVRYDVAANTWSTGYATIPNNMSSATAVTLGDKIYLFGGENTGGLGKTLMYDPVANTWTPKANMPTLVTDALVVKFDDNFVYVIGGGTGLFGTGYFNNVQLYDVAANTYTACTPYPVAAGMMGGGMLNYTIFAAGGWNGTAAIANAYKGTVNPSDMTQITWTPVGDYPATGTTRMASFPVTWGSTPSAAGFFFTGGAIGGSTLTGLTYLYNFCTDAWETLTPNLAQARSNFKGCGKMDNVVYVVGGFTTVGVGTSDKATLTNIAGNCYTPIGGGTGFFDNFDSYIVGQQLACQNPTDWTTWSNLPCNATEDPVISNTYSYSPTNTVKIVQNNDLVKTFGAQTTGKWYVSFLYYIPATKAGYFNLLTEFAGAGSEWGMECYFNTGGVGELRISSPPYNSFTWQVGTWNQALVIVDLDLNQAEFLTGTTDPLTSVATWQWTRGGTLQNQLDAADLFGATANDEMYVDDFYFDVVMPPIIPVELTSFTANVINGVVELNWQTATEINNQGFQIERRTESTDFENIGFVAGSGTTTELRSYTYSDMSVGSGTYFYRLKQVDFDGTFEYSNEVEVEIIGVLSFNLEQNYPNPFNPSTSIRYSIPEAGNIKLSVYSVVGEEVAVLINGYTEAGSFDVSFDASNLPSGVYLYKLQSANSIQTKKMMLLK